MNRSIVLGCFLVSSYCLSQDSKEFLQLEIAESNLSDESLEKQVGQVDLIKFEKQDLNEIPLNEIMALPFLNQEQKHNLIEFLRENRPLFHINEIQTIKGFSAEHIQWLSARFLVVRKITFQDLKQKFFNPDVSFLLYRVKGLTQQKEGFKKDPESGGFLGNSLATRFRILHRKYGNYSIGILLDKDAGEVGIKDIADPWRQAYWSAHLFLEPNKTIKKICFGDFFIQHGEGLIFSQGFSMGKGPETIYSIKRPEPGLRPYTSSFERGNFRGFATSIDLKGTEITSYYSDLDLNATIYNQGAGIGPFFKSLNSSGTFRTSADQEKLSSLSLRSAGGFLKRKLFENKLSFSLNFRHDQFQYPWIREGKTLAEKGLTHAGSSFSFQEKNFFSFGEFAVSDPGAHALILGSIIQATRKLDLGVLFRSLSPSFVHLNANPFGEFSGARNEQGTYLSFRWIPNHKISIEGYSDLFSRIAPQNHQSLLSTGLDNLIHLRYRKSRSDIFRLVIRNEKKSNIETTKDQQNFRSYFSYQREFSPIFRSNTKFLFNHFSSEGSQSGFGLSQELIIGNSKKNLSAMVCLFDTESHATAIYLFEKNLFWEYSIPSFSGSGLHMNILAKFRPMNRVSIWVRLNHTSYLDRDQVGSGLDQIDGNQKTELAGMLRLSLF